MSRFQSTAIFQHLTQYYTDKELSVGQIDEDTLAKQKSMILDELDLLSQSIILPNGGPSKQLERFLTHINVQVSDVDAGMLIIHPRIKEGMYYDSVIGDIEAQFLHYLANLILNHKKSDDEIMRHMQAMQELHDEQFNAEWHDYNENLTEFNPGDFGYTYEGAIYPEQPNIAPFDEYQARNEYIVELESISLDTPEDCIDYLTDIKFSPDDSLGEYLHEWFYDTQAYEEIIDAIDDSKVNVVLLNYMFRNHDFFFSGFDVTTPRFLLKILNQQISELDLTTASKYSREDCISMLLFAIPEESEVDELLHQYNNAVIHQDDINLQRTWYYIIDYCNALDQLITKSKGKMPETSEIWAAIKQRHDDIKSEKQQSLDALIKVLPTKEVKTLSYYDQSCAKKIDMSLQPCLHTLAYVAKEGHKTLVSKMRDEKTNVVTAMLCFVVSATMLKDQKTSSGFIKVPLDFDYPERIVSIDEAFKGGTDDVERSVAEMLQRGCELAGRSPADSDDVSDKMINRIHRFIDTFGISEDKKKEILDSLKAAPAEEPHAQAYYMASDVAKSTLHRHSERSLLRALKDPGNSPKLVELVRQAIQDLGISEEASYTLMCGALVAYSYPNSICDPCCLSFLGLLVNTKSLFISQFQDCIEKSNHGSSIMLSLADGFSMTTIAGSNKTFNNDQAAKMLGTTHRYPCYFNEHNPQQILLSQGAKPKPWLYEFIGYEHRLAAADKPDPYHGMLFMSGSKQSKIKTKDGRDQAEAAYNELVEKHNASLHADS